MITVEPFGEATTSALAALFDRCGCACYCRYFHFSGTKNEWLDRLAHRPHEGRDELAAAAARDEVTGLVARDAQGQLVGWAKVTPLASVPKLRNQGAYRPLDLGDEATTWVVGCLLVAPEARKSGVGRALVAHAPGYARARGASRLLGMPRRAALPLYDEEAFAGPERVYADEGFRVVHDSPAYPVYALDL
jgi:GNAT superfamily N-acetyltransferase